MWHEAQFDVIKQGRAWLKADAASRQKMKGRVPLEPSQATVDQYERYVRKLPKTADKIWAHVKDTEKRSTFNYRRAAVVNHYRQVIASAMKQQDYWQRFGFSDKNIVQKWYDEIEKVELALEIMKGEIKYEDFNPSARRETKRADLYKLPENWREELVSDLKEYKNAGIVSALTGCRPVELERNPVKISIESGTLKIRIVGAKVSAISGQEWREISYKLPSSNPLAKMLVGLVEANDGKMEVQISDAREFSGAVREAGRRAKFDGFTRTITPYSFRHQFSSDMKAAGKGDETSQAMGHSVSDTRSTYGIFGVGHASRAPDVVASAREVRTKKTPDFSAMKKNNSVKTVASSSNYRSAFRP